MNYKITVDEKKLKESIKVSTSPECKKPKNLMLEKARKPPIGIEAEFIWKNRRRIELEETIKRYLSAGFEIPLIWVGEYNKLSGGGIFKG
jgi:hypothetical protein